jgi:hypothetical protein
VPDADCHTQGVNAGRISRGGMPRQYPQRQRDERQRHDLPDILEVAQEQELDAGADQLEDEQSQKHPPDGG